jgi:hypothetical protein
VALRESATRVFVHYDDGDKSWAVRKRQQWLVAAPAATDSPQREAPLTAAEVLVRSAEQVPARQANPLAPCTAATRPLLRLTLTLLLARMARCCGGVRHGGP